MSDGTDHGIRFGRIAAMLPVKDINRACDFYTKALGFTKVFENGTPVGFMILKAIRRIAPDATAESHGASFNVAHMMVDYVFDAIPTQSACQASGSAHHQEPPGYTVYYGLWRAMLSWTSSGSRDKRSMNVARAWP